MGLLYLEESEKMNPQMIWNWFLALGLFYQGLLVGGSVSAAAALINFRRWLKARKEAKLALQVGEAMSLSHPGHELYGDFEVYDQEDHSWMETLRDEDKTSN